MIMETLSRRPTGTEIDAVYKFMQEASRSVTARELAGYLPKSVDAEDIAEHMVSFGVAERCPRTSRLAYTQEDHQTRRYVLKKIPEEQRSRKLSFMKDVAEGKKVGDSGDSETEEISRWLSS